MKNEEKRNYKIRLDDALDFLEFNLLNKKSWDFISSSVNNLASFPSISINALIFASAASFKLIFSLIGPAGKKL